MLIDLIETDFKFEDDRGRFVQLVRRGYSQVNVVFSKKGVIRGNHCHKYNTEAFYMVSGKCKVLVSREGESEEAVFEEGDFFRIAPGILHSFEYLDDTVIVSMYSMGVEMEGNEKDM